MFSKETTDFSEYPDREFEYLEISGVELGSNAYRTTVTAVSQAPSRAKMKTQSGDIVISTTRPHRGAIAKIQTNGIIASTGFSIIREVESCIDKTFLLYTMLSNIVLQQMAQRSSGGNYPAIVEDEIKKIYFPVPDYPTQQRMVKIFDKSIANRTAQYQHSNEILCSFYEHISNIFGLKAEKNKRLCYAIKLKNIDGVIDAKRYASINDTTSSQKIMDVCEIIENKVNVSNMGNQVIDWIRIDDLPNQPLDIETIRTQPANEVEGTFFEVQKGDILVARLGPTILNQKIVIVRHLERKTIASAEFLVLRVKDGYDPEAVMAILKTTYYRDLMYSHARGSTPSRYRLNREDMLKLPFPDIKSRQVQIAAESNDVREQVKNMRVQAEQEWKEAKRRFEKELLGD